jgi:hypothetical protein
METFNQVLECEKVFFPYLQLVRAFGSRLKDNQTAGFGIHKYISESFIDNLMSQGTATFLIRVVEQMLKFTSG